MSSSRAQPPASGTQRLAGLDALRGLAALTIIVLHVWLYTTTSSAARSGLVEGVLHELRLALPLFFVLSGYLLYRAWVGAVLDGRRPPRLRRYLSARVRRLVPGAWLCLVVTVPLLLLLEGVRGVDVPDLGLLPLFVVFGQAFHPGTVAEYNPPMWTLTVEASFYLVLPLLGGLALLLARRRRSRAALLVAPLVLAAAGTAWNVWLTGRPGSLVLASALPALGTCFAAGMAAAVLGHGRSLGRGAVAALACGAAALVVLNGVWHESGTAAASDAGRIWRDSLAAAGFALLLVAVAHARRPSRLLESRALAWLGERSYGMYLWHMPAIFLLRGVGAFPEGQTVPAVLAVLAVVLPVAHLSWTRVERPLLTAGRRQRPEPRPPTPAGQPRPAMGGGAGRPRPVPVSQ